MSNNGKKISITKDGPYLVSGSILLGTETIICDNNDIPVKWEKGKDLPLKETYALCRCGRSKTKPFCDGSHVKAGFDGTEVASRKPYLERAEKTIGPGLDLTDCEDLCAIARFCHRASDTWTLTEDSADPVAKKTAIEEACDCPSGRLIAWDKKTGKPIEPNFTQSISLVEDSCKKVSGPLWVKGGIPVISSDGFQYEVRNRVTLCRCGASKNKPFCDGSHCPSEKKNAIGA
jgi:CDGSH-type Zn-finger protein